MNVSWWWVQAKWHSESGHWWFQSLRCIATQRLLQPPHKVQPLHLFIIQCFSKGHRRWSVGGECWHVFVLPVTGFHTNFETIKSGFLTWCHSNHELDVKPSCMLNSNRTDQNLRVTEQGMRSYKWRKTGRRVFRAGYLAPIPARLRGRGSHAMLQEPALLACKMTVNQYIYTCWSDVYLFFPGHWKNHLD